MFCDDSPPNMGRGEAVVAQQVYVDGLLWFDRDEEPVMPPQVGHDVTPSWHSGSTPEIPGTSFPSETSWSQWTVPAEDITGNSVLDAVEEATTMSGDATPFPTNWGKFCHYWKR